jgi:hypothetical protein
MNLIVEAYPLDYEFKTKKVTRLVVNEKNLRRLLTSLSKNDIIYSFPHKYKGEYEVYVLGSVDVKEYKATKGFVMHIKDLSPNIKEEIAYIAFRQFLYKNGFKQGSSSKIYNPNKVLYGNDSLKIYEAVVTGIDSFNGKSHLFIDATRKMEFVYPISDLEKYPYNKLDNLHWLKVLGSTTSFIVNINIQLQHYKNNISIDEIVERSKRFLAYLNETGRIPHEQASIEFDGNDLFEYGLIPKSLKLRQEARSEGLLLPVDGVENVIFLPKKVLVPVASRENVKLLIDSSTDIDENLKIAPYKRHQEINSFLNDFNYLELDDLILTISTTPIKVPMNKVNKIYLEGVSMGKDLFSKIIKWNVIEKLAQYKKEVAFYLLGYNENYVNYIANKLQKFTYLKDLIDDLSDLDKLSFIESIQHPKNKIVLIVGPQDIDQASDEKLRNEIEYKFISKGMFCWYLSTRDKDIMKLNYKLQVVLRELATRLNIFSHSLLPLIIQGNQIKRIMGIDATTCELSRSQLRIATAILIFDVIKASYKVDFNSYVSDRGEDAAIAETIKKELLEKNYDGLTLVYLNRARPNSVLSYLNDEEVNEIFNRAIIIGATKTHNYSRILMEGDHGLANPELLSYYPLYEDRDVKVAGTPVSISKYLAITTTATKISDLTVKPVLFTILIGGKYKNVQNLSREILNYSITQCLLNNTSITWLHSLPWPLHHVDKILKRAQRLAPDELLNMLNNVNILRVL